MKRTYPKPSHWTTRVSEVKVQLSYTRSSGKWIVRKSNSQVIIRGKDGGNTKDIEHMDKFIKGNLYEIIELNVQDS